MLTRWKAGRIGKAGALQAKQFARELEERADTATRARLAAMAATSRHYRLAGRSSSRTTLPSSSR